MAHHCDNMCSPASGQIIPVNSRLLEQEVWLNHATELSELLVQAQIDVQLRPLIDLFLSQSRAGPTLGKSKIIDSIVLLGHCLNPDGSASEVLRSRLQSTRQAADIHPHAQIIVSGGNPSGAPLTEAAVMKDWLVAQGVEPKRIVCEARSTDTMENVVFTTDLFLRDSDTSILLVTSKTHMLRAAALFGVYLSKKSMAREVVLQPVEDALNLNENAESFLLFKDLGRITDFWKYCHPKLSSIGQ